MPLQTPADIEFRPLTIPSSVHDSAAADFIAMVDVRNRVHEQINGNTDESITPAELLPHYLPAPHEIRVSWLILADGAVVGRAGVDIPLEGESRTAFWLIELVASAQGRGIGTAAYELIEKAARAHGRTVLQSWATHPAADGPRIEAPTGYGSIPDDHIARFYRRHGYRLEQIERQSVFDLHAPFDGVERLLATAQAAAIGYEVVQWVLPTPHEHIAGYAWMKSRMSTDVPSAAMEFDEEVWDAERLWHHDRMYTDADRLLLVTAARHVASGDLCAFNELVVGTDRTQASAQEDTLVLKEHRGHRLGTLVKCAGLMKWRELAPDSPRIITYNAEENRPMLDINEALGFVPVAYSGAWKKVLTG
ncbi:GNAT family N-acetyltransferase [Microbacterium koreense]|uniref:GNAT family N-acetyltransferase n=1 Tax=Microbacterium koreense TaxID=323761 RepID=A0ABW2ZS38_9MICO